MIKIITMLGIIVLIVSLTSLANAGKVYLISGGDNDQNNAIKDALEGFGHQVTIGVDFGVFDGTQDITMYDEVILLYSKFIYDDMPASGQVVLLNFIYAGGGLITGEMVTLNAAVWPPKTAILRGAFPSWPNDGTNTPTCTYTAVTPDTTLNYLVAPSFTFNATFYNGYYGARGYAKPGATTFYADSIGNPALLGWNYGSGRVLSFSSPIGPNELLNINYRQLLSNAVDWRPGPPIVKSDIYLISRTAFRSNYDIMRILVDSGHIVTVGPPPNYFYGLSNLNDYKVVILLDDSYMDSLDMPDTGQQTLLDFINSGKGLITGEFCLVNTYYGIYTNLSAAFPGSWAGLINSPTVTYTVQTPNLVLNAGLPAEFTFAVFNGRYSLIEPKTGATSFYGSSPMDAGLAGLVGWRYGRGKVLNFSTTISDELMVNDSNFEKLLLNAMKWVATHPSVDPIWLLLLE